MGRPRATKAEISNTKKSIRLNLTDGEGMAKLAKELNKTPSYPSQERQWISCLAVQTIYSIHCLNRNKSDLLKHIRKAKDYITKTKKVRVEKVSETLQLLYPIGVMPMGIQALRRFYNFQAIPHETTEYLHPLKVEKLIRSLEMLQKVVKQPTMNFVKATKQELLSTPKTTIEGPTRGRKKSNEIMMSSLTPEFHIDLFLKSLKINLNISNPELSEDSYHLLLEAFSTDVSAYNYRDKFDFKPS